MIKSSNSMENSIDSVLLNDCNRDRTLEDSIDEREIRVVFHLIIRYFVDLKFLIETK